MQPKCSTAASSKTGSLAGIGPKWINKVAWFVRITAVLVLVASTLGIIQAGWPHNLRDSGSLLGLFNGALLFAVSFLYGTTGTTRRVMTAATIVLGASVLVFSLALSWMPLP